MSTMNQVGVGLSGSTGTGAFVGSTSPTLVTPTLGAATATNIKFTGSQMLLDANGNSVLANNAVGSAVNYIGVSNNVTTNFPYFIAAGTDTNIDFGIFAKGTGKINLISEATNAGLTFYSGTSHQHGTTFFCADTANNRTVTFPDKDFKLSGTVQQIVSTTLTTSFSASSTGSTWVDITGLSQAITPASSSNTVLVRVAISAAGGSATNPLYFQIVRTSTAVGIGTSVGSKTAVGSGICVTQLYSLGSCILEFLDSPATTSATTYKIQFANVNAAGAITCYVNRSVTDTDSAIFPRGVSTITLMEIQP